MNLDEMEEALAAKAATIEANKQLARRWLGNHNLGTQVDPTAGWSYPCRNNCHSHCQSAANGTCSCPCHDAEWCGAGSC